MSEQFCLRWNNHQSTLISVFENLLESESLIDCTLCAEGQILKAHKVVLSACSPTFETMLCIQEEKHPIIFLKDVRFIELKAMIDYMYKGEVNILQDQLDSFLKTAAALQIKGLTDQGGGGGDEPPAKKGPGRKTGMSDVAPESPLVGNAPLREGSMSPTRRRRRLPRRPSSAEDGSADNSSCDIPPPAVAAPPSVAAQPAPLPASEPSPRLTVKKQEPLDPPLITPKQEQLDEPAEDIEDLTLDDDDDYNDAMSEMSKPGTSFGAMGPGNTSQDFSQWQQMMSGNQAGTDEVFMAAQEAINNQTNTQEWLSTAPTLDFFPFEETCDPSLGAQPVQAKRKRGRPRKSVVNNIVGDVEPDKDENRSGRSRLDKQKRFKDQRPATDQDVALDGRRGDGGRLRPMKSRASNELGSSHSSRAKIQRVNPVRKSGVGKDRVLVDRLPGRKTQMQEDSVGSKISKSDGRKNERERSQEVRRQKNVKINGTIGSLEVRAPNVDPPSRERERSQKIGQLVRQKHCEGDMGTNKRMLRPRPSPGGVGNETKQRVNSKQKLGNPTKSGYGKGKSQEIGRIEQTERKMPSNERIMGLRRLAPEVYSSDPLPAPDKTKPKLLVGKVKRSKKNVQNMTNVDVRAVGDWLRPRSSLSQKRGHSPQLVSKGCEGMSTYLVPPSTSQQVKRKRGRPRKTVPVTMEDIAIGETTGDGGQLLQQEKPGESSKRENECVNPLRINKDMDVEHRIFDLEQLNEHSESLRVQDVYEPKESLIIGSVKSVSLAERSTMTAEVGQSPNAENLRSFQEEETYEDGITDDGLKSQSNYCEVIEVVRKHQGPFQEEETHEGGMADDGLKSQSNYCEVIKVVRKHQGSSPVGTEGDRAPVKDEQWLRQLERPIKCEISNLQPDQEDLEYVQPANSSMGETEEHSFVEGSHVLETVKLQIDQSSSHQANFPRSDLAKIQEVKVEQGIVEYGLFTGLVDEDIGHLQQKNQCCSPPSTGETAGSCNGSSASCFP